MTPEQLCAHILSGIGFAQKKYFRISGGNWLWTGSEHFMSNCIAERLVRQGGGRFLCTVEESLYNFNLGPGRPNIALRMNGRADIAIWDTYGEPVGIVEAKYQKRLQTCEDDFLRITSFSRRAGRFGAFAYYCSFRRQSAESARAFATKRAEQFSSYLLSYPPKRELQVMTDFVISRPVQDEDRFSTWLAFAAVFYSPTVRV